MIGLMLTTAKLFHPLNVPAKTLPVASGATLVVTPRSVLSQWAGEIEKHVTAKHLTVHTYYGTKKVDDPYKLSKFDVVLTTYSTIMNEANPRGKKMSKTKGLAHVKWHRIVLDEG
jgi:SWI/SNF-related matrix-associated actin-dependent regulator of chromatin subfamily A3